MRVEFEKMLWFNVGETRKMNAVHRLEGLGLVIATGFGLACSGESCPVGEIRGSDGGCYRDPTYVVADCLTEIPLSGSVRSQEMAVNAFAFVETGENGFALIGFQRDQDACSVVENHVTGFEYWHDGLVVDMSIRGSFEEGEVLELVTSTAQEPLSPEMSIRVAETDEWVEKTLAGEARVSRWSPGEILEIEVAEAVFEEGSLSGQIRACHCPELDGFWEVLAPDI